VFELTSPSSFLGGFGINPMSSPTSEPVARTSSYGTPSPSKNNNDERLPPRPVAHGAAVAADAASPREHTLLVKRTLGVSHSSPRGRWKRCNNGVNHRSRPFGRWERRPPGIDYCSRLAGRWERFVGGRRCHGRWFRMCILGLVTGHGSETYHLHAGRSCQRNVSVTCTSQTCNSHSLAFSASFRSYFSFDHDTMGESS
jgi:hypothetical protein